MKDKEKLSDVTVEDSEIQGQSEPAMPKRSRLRQNIINRTKKSLFLSLAAIVVVITLIVIFGVPFLVTFADLISREETPSEQPEQELVIILPPYITPDFEATNSAEISLTGTAEDGEKIFLYRDDRKIKELRRGSDSTFVFTNIELTEGKNTFRAKVMTGDKESRLSDPVTISYLKDAPDLSIDYPSEGQDISNKDGDRLQVEGSTHPDATITINGSQAIVSDDGTFKFFIPIKGGENTIKVIATDVAGNKTELERKFTYNP